MYHPKNMYYPKNVFSIREDVTRENMRKYDQRLEKYYAEREKREKDLGRRLTLNERYELRKQFDV